MITVRLEILSGEVDISEVLIPRSALRACLKPIHVVKCRLRSFALLRDQSSVNNEGRRAPMMKPKALRALLIATVLCVVSADAATPVSDWVDSKQKQVIKALASIKASESARCGLQTDREAYTECTKAFGSVVRHNNEIIKYDLERIRDVDKIKNPVLREKLMVAENAAFNLDNDAVLARLRAVEEIFKVNLVAR